MPKKAYLGRVSDVDLRLLRVFRSVVACGGVSAAELELNIGRSTISRHLTDLEVRLGVKLCTRGPAGFALTSEGKRVLSASSRLLSALNTFQSEVDDVHQRLAGHLSIALFDKSITNPEARLPQAIMLFDETAPMVTIEIYAEPVNVIENGVMTGRFEVGIIPIHGQSSSINCYPIYSEQMYLYCGEGHKLFDRADRKIPRRAIQQCKYAGIGFHSPNMMVSHQLNLKRSADAYDEEALAALILSGRFIGFLPDHYAKSLVERGELRRLRPDVYHYQSDHAAIVRRSPKPSRLISEFVDCLRRAHS